MYEIINKEVVAMVAMERRQNLTLINQGMIVGARKKRVSIFKVITALGLSQAIVLGICEFQTSTTVKIARYKNGTTNI